MTKTNQWQLFRNHCLVCNCKDMKCCPTPSDAYANQSIVYTAPLKTRERRTGAVVAAITCLGIHPVEIKPVRQQLDWSSFCAPSTSHSGRIVDGAVVLRLLLTARVGMSTAINTFYHHPYSSARKGKLTPIYIIGNFHGSCIVLCSHRIAFRNNIHPYAYHDNSLII